MKFIKEISSYILIILVVILIRTFIISPVRVDGISMVPTLSNGDFMLVEKFDKNFKRFDIVVLHDGSSRLIKRVIGLPGEKIEYKDETLYVNGKIVNEKFIKGSSTADFSITELGYKKIPKDYYLVLGDNRAVSLDSRTIGLIKKSDIYGKAIFNFNKFIGDFFK